MAIKSIHSFQNVSTTVEDILDPNTGQMAGRAFVMIDQDDGSVWRCPMPVDVAKRQGQRLMGIGEVQLPSGADVAAVGRQNGKH